MKVKISSSSEYNTMHSLPTARSQVTSNSKLRHCEVLLFAAVAVFELLLCDKYAAAYNAFGAYIYTVVLSFHALTAAAGAVRY